MSSIANATPLNQQRKKKRPLVFDYYSGSGNLFLITHIDEIHALLSVSEIIQDLNQSFSERFDGVIFLEKKSPYPIMHYFNKDGSRAAMCGNGLRSSMMYLFQKNRALKNIEIMTDCGLRRGHIHNNSLVAVDMGQYNITRDLIQKTIPVAKNQPPIDLISIDTGVPHVVFSVSDIETFPIFAVGKAIRYHEAFMPQGTNVNVIEQIGATEWKIRTYERGVEDETGACGTGATAAALTILSFQNLAFQNETRKKSEITLFFHSGESASFVLSSEDGKNVTVTLTASTSKLSDQTILVDTRY